MFAPRALENTQSSLLTEPEEGATALLEQLPHFYHHFFPDLFSLDLDFFPVESVQMCWADLRKRKQLRVIGHSIRCSRAKQTPKQINPFQEK